MALSLLISFLAFLIGPHYVAQTGPQCLDSSDPPVSASELMGITGHTTMLEQDRAFWEGISACSSVVEGLPRVWDNTLGLGNALREKLGFCFCLFLVLGLNPGPLAQSYTPSEDVLNEYHLKLTSCTSTICLTGFVASGGGFLRGLLLCLFFSLPDYQEQVCHSETR